MAERLAGLPQQSVRLVMAYCNCPERAEQFKQDLFSICRQLREIVVVPTGALSTMYANDGGVVIAF